MKTSIRPWRACMAALVLLAAVTACQEAAASIEDCLHATCRISSNGSVGTGCAFEIVENEVRILTNYHVAGGHQVNVQFYSRGHQSAPILAASRWFSFHDSAQRDMNVVAVPVAAFGGYLPKIMPLAEANTPLPEGLPIVSAGCEEGRWPSAWMGHIVENEGRIIKFVPKAIPGRSGSSLFDEAGERIIGLIAWHDGTYGVAMTVGDIRAAFAGQMPAAHYPPRTLAATDINDLPMVTVERSLVGRKCVHGVSLADYCQFCGPGGCPPFQQRPRLHPQQPQQGNGGVYGTRPPDEGGTVLPGPAPGLSKYATKDDLSALEKKLVSQASDLVSRLPDNSGLIERITELESDHKNLASKTLLGQAIEKAKADLSDQLKGGLGGLKADILGGHPNLQAAIDKAKGDFLAVSGEQTGEAIKGLNDTVIKAAEGKALNVVNSLVVDKLAGVATGGAATGLLPMALAGGLPTLGIALAGWLISRKVGGSGGAAAGRPFPGNQASSGY